MRLRKLAKVRTRTNLGTQPKNRVKIWWAEKLVANVGHKWPETKLRVPALVQSTMFELKSIPGN
jgi:hypothetical protein